MDKLHIVYRDVSTAQFPISIKNINYLSTPSRKITEYEIPGRDGKLYIDEGTFDNFTLEVEIFIKARGQKLVDICRQINRWLLTDFKKRKLSISNIPDYYYIAIVKDGIDVKKATGNNGECTIKFICEPLKRSVYGDDIVTIYNNNTTIYNQEGFKTQPYLKIFGSGNVTVSIGGRDLILKNIQEYIEVDTELQNCFKDNVNQNHKMYSDFPFLSPGENVISWQGNVNKIELKPRYRHL